jgi:excisionase family DNA binding protein
LEAKVVSLRGNAPFNAPFNILTALYSLTGLLSVEEVAEMFGKSPDTIYRMAQKRQIPNFMFGGSRSFDPSGACALVDQERPTTRCCCAVFSERRLNESIQMRMAGSMPAIPF